MNNATQRIESAVRVAATAVALLVAGAAGAASQPAAPTPTPTLTGPEASIPFANHGGIYDYHAENDRGIWVQARNGQWYYGQFFAPCLGIQFANAVGFRTSPSGTLDRWASVISREGGRCELTSLRSSEPPPGYSPRGARKASKAQK